MDYQQSLAYLYERLPIFQRVGGAAYKPGLERITALLEALGRPHDNFSSILIAGTNGKGSTSSMLASVLQSSGLENVGLYTSPHLRHFTERIRINGKPCTEDFVVRFVERLKPLIDEIEPSFFEVTAAMAFSYFAEQYVDYAVVEVGMGGRLDATNVLQPHLSIITNIGWDHMEFLGDTRAKIAAEKAGIIRAGSPVVIGEKDPETKPVFGEIARNQYSWCLFSEDYFEVEAISNDLTEQIFGVRNIKQVGLQDLNGPFEEYGRPYKSLQPPVFAQDNFTLAIDLCGGYQADNLRTVLLALEVLQQRDASLQLNGTKIRHGLARVKAQTGLRGRFDLIEQQPQTVADVAHNPNGLRSLMVQIEGLVSPGKLHIVFGVSGDKPISEMLPLLPRQAHYYWVQASGPRAMAAEKLAEVAEPYGLNGMVFGDILKGLTAAQDAAKAQGIDSLVLVTGSIFVVAEVVD